MKIIKILSIVLPGLCLLLPLPSAAQKAEESFFGTVAPASEDNSFARAPRATVSGLETDGAEFYEVGTGTGNELISRYDDQNRLIRVEKYGHYIIFYSYDETGNRTELITTASLDYEPDGDIDGFDLAVFSSNFEIMSTKLADLAVGFGQ